VSSFRSEFAYVDNLSLVAANLVQRRSGLTWAENLQQSLFEPLGMTASSSGQEAFHAAANTVSPHKRVHDTVSKGQTFIVSAPKH
jgi:CubicO group peptidase (beta-lactamase class C family)